MTIYECLGIGEYLIDETIPTDLIIENIDRADLRYDAGVFFQDITRVSIRASLNRGNHFMQVVEVELNNVDHISEISVLIQKAIRYQVLFVFVYEDRYLILRRSFNLTTSTEHVYTDHASFSTDWIYGECLEDDLVALVGRELDLAEGLLGCVDGRTAFCLASDGNLGNGFVRLFIVDRDGLLGHDFLTADVQGLFFHGNTS